MSPLWRAGLLLGLFAVLAIAEWPSVAFAQQSAQQAPLQVTVPDTDEGTDSSSLTLFPSSYRNDPPARTHDWLLEPAWRVFDDQRDIWSSPKNLRFSDTIWLIPTSGFAAGLFATDTEAARHRSYNPATISRYKNVSNADVFALAGSAGLLWALSYKDHDEHRRETGQLAAEAALNSLIVSESLKYSFGRQRPLDDQGRGEFFKSGASFPSEHVAAAWSIASIIAHEYPGPLTKLLAYGAAGLVSYSRVKANQHFPSDVLAGALIGEFSAYTVYRRHHDPELGGDNWVSWSSRARDLFNDPAPGNRGSPYVPLDSWVYPALDRLAGWGLVDSGFAGMRPWTRRECARLVSEAGDRIAIVDSPPGQIYRQLAKEFSPELALETGPSTGAGPVARVESVYSNVGHISGMPLTDGYHFAQTQINNFGRPYGEGWNTSTGFSFYAVAGPWSGYFRGEEQTAPSLPALSPLARKFIAYAEQLPDLPPATATPSVQQFKMLDAYVGLTLSNWELSSGQQSLSWGPGEGGSLMFSDNAAPIKMIRLNRVSPLGLPLLSRFLGPLRLEVFFGQLGGQQFTGGPNGATSGSFNIDYQPQPFLHGQRFSFKPTRNFEFGFSRTTIMGGPGVPLTFGTFGKSLFGLGNGTPGTPSDPGDRRSGLDWSYRLPMLRNWVTFYGEAFTDDQFTPIAYLDRSAIRAGLYLSRVPKLPKVDLRVEGVYTDVPAGGALSHGFYYFNFRFKEGYTNDGTLLGSWIGREGQGAQAWANYWFGARNRVQANFRHEKVSNQFVPLGGTVTDFGLRGYYWAAPGLGFTTSLQYERWLFPVLRPGPQRDISSSVGIQIQPQKLVSNVRSLFM
jgi:capsule assembly protein Wzi/PAP2 superfamily protein